jgi:hypothetical protein
MTSWPRGKSQASPSGKEHWRMSSFMNRVAKDAWEQTGRLAQERLEQLDLQNGTDFVSSGRLDHMTRRMLANNGLDATELLPEPAKRKEDR